MGDVVYIAEAVAIEGDPWRIVEARIIPHGETWGVAYRCANGKSCTQHVGTQEQAQAALRPVGATLPAPDVLEPISNGRQDELLIIVLKDLYASNIHTQIASAMARGWIVRLGDRENGCVAERVFANDHLERAADWLIREALRAYPASAFAKRYAGFAAS
jgi:plasmid replication initiation protein